MEGMVLKLGLELWPLYLCNGKISKIHSHFSILWYVVSQVYFKTYIPNDMLKWNYFIFLKFLSMLTVSFLFILEAKQILGLCIVQVREIKS